MYFNEICTVLGLFVVLSLTLSIGAGTTVTTISFGINKCRIITSKYSELRTGHTSNDDFLELYFEACSAADTIATQHYFIVVLEDRHTVRIKTKIVRKIT